MSTFAASLSYADLNPEAIHAVKLRFIDAVACALGGFSSNPAQIARRVAARVSSTTPARVLGTDIETSPEMAAFANGVAIRYLDFNDDYFGLDGPHPSDLFAPTLAVCESLHGDGKSFITASTVAYEILCNLVDAVHLMGKGWDYTTHTVIAAALGAGKALGLNKEQLGNAVALAITPHCALAQSRSEELSMWKGCAGPHACRSGVFAALLAQEGMTGPEKPVEGIHGLWNQVSGPYELEPFGGNGRPYKVQTIYLKYWPVRYTAQLPVWVALGLREQVKLEEIESLIVEMYSRYVLTGGAEREKEKWRPQTRETADHSIPFCVAAALLDGGVSLKTFDSRRFLDRDVIDLMQKIQLREDPEFSRAFPEEWHCRITAVTRSGERHQVHLTNPRGHPKNPMPDHEVEEKYFRLAEGVLGPQRARTLLERLWRLEEVGEVGEILDLAQV